MVEARQPLGADGLDALVEMAGDDPRARDALARAGRVGLRIGLAGPALLLYALSAAEAVRRGGDPAGRLAADLAQAGIEQVGIVQAGIEQAGIGQAGIEESAPPILRLV